MGTLFDNRGDSVHDFLNIADLGEGDVVAGKYRIVRVIGEGSFGRVYEAEDLNLGRRVALKTVFTNATHEHSKRFQREIKLIKGIEHGNVVRLYDYGQADNDLLYMVMEFVEGRNLEEVLESEGPFDHRRALGIIYQVLDALVEAQKVGIVHRDLKPANIVLTEKGIRKDVVKILDFGLAKTYDGSGVSQIGFVSSSFACGTPLYMAPEQIENGPTGPYTDVYAVGLLVIEMITGVAPFVAENIIQLLAEKASRKIRADWGLFDPRIVPIIKRAIEHDPKQRFGTAREMVMSLLSVSEGNESSGFGSFSSRPSTGPSVGLALDPADGFFGDHAGTSSPVRETRRTGITQAPQKTQENRAVSRETGSITLEEHPELPSETERTPVAEADAPPLASILRPSGRRKRRRKLED